MLEDERQLPSETEIAETKVSCQPDLLFFARCSATILSVLHSSKRGMYDGQRVGTDDLRYTIRQRPICSATQAKHHDHGPLLING